MEILLILLIILTLVVGMVLGVNAIQAASKDQLEPTEGLRESKLCKDTHSWDKVKVASFEDLQKFESGELTLEQFKSRPDDLYCKKCGLIPRMGRMLKTGFLKEVNLANLKNKHVLETQAMTIELRDEFISNYLKLKERTKEEIHLIREGYMVYDDFVLNLGKLLENKRTDQMVESIIERVLNEKEK